MERIDLFRNKSNNILIFFIKKILYFSIGGYEKMTSIKNNIFLKKIPLTPLIRGKYKESFFIVSENLKI